MSLFPSSLSESPLLTPLTTLLSPTKILSYILTVSTVTFAFVVLPQLWRYYTGVRKQENASRNLNPRSTALILKDCLIYTIILYRFLFIFILTTRRGFYFTVYLYVVYGNFGFNTWMLLAPLIPALIHLMLELYLSWKDARTRELSKKEYIDLGPKRARYTQEEYEENLKDMGFLNRYLGADYSIMTLGFEPLLGKPHVHSDKQQILKRKHANQVMGPDPDEEPLLIDETSSDEDESDEEADESNPTTVLEVGCGAGWLSRLLAANYPFLRVTAIDTGKEAIRFARKITSSVMESEPRLKNITYHELDHPELEYEDESFDIVTCCLMCHHIVPEKSLVEFLSRAYRVCKRAVVISDLERDMMPLFLYRTFIWPTKENRLTQHDGYLSVRRAFTGDDWKRLLKAAGLTQHARLYWTPAQRWILILDK